MSGNKPVLHLFKEKIAAAVAAATNGKLTDQQVLECLEDCKADGFDFSFPMMKLRRYKIAEDPKTLVEEWKNNVRGASTRSDPFLLIVSNDLPCIKIESNFLHRPWAAAAIFSTQRSGRSRVLPSLEISRTQIE
jgi:hypothetical protein